MIRIALICAVALAAGCSVVDNVVPRDNGYARERAMAEIAIVSTTADQTPAPDDDDGGGVEVGDPCPTCNDPPGACGVGQVGDGRHCTRCRKCNGDGRIDRDDIAWLGFEPDREDIGPSAGAQQGAAGAQQGAVGGDPHDDCCGDNARERSYVLQRDADQEIDTQEIDTQEIELQEIGLQRIRVQEIGERRYGAAAAPERTKEIVLRMTSPARDGWPSDWYANQRQQFEDAGWTVRAQLDPSSEHDVAFFDVYTPSGAKKQFFEPIELGDVQNLE